MVSFALHLNFKQVFTIDPSGHGEKGQYASNAKLDKKIKNLNLWAIIGGPIVGLIKLVIIIGNAYFYPKDQEIEGTKEITIIGDRTFSYLLANAIRAIGDCFFLGAVFIIIDFAADKIYVL